MNRHKIVFVLLGAYPYFNREIGVVTSGGAEVDLYYTAKNLDPALFDVHFIVGDYEQEKREVREGVTLHKVSRNSFLRLLFLLHKLQPDSIFSKGISWQTVYLILIKNILGVKLFIKSSHKRNINGELSNTFYGKICKMLINSLDAFVLQNEEDRPLFQKTYPNFKNSLVCIRNFQEVSEINPHNPFEKSLLWVGRAEAFKRPELYLELAKKLPEWQCVMVMPKTEKPLFTEIVEQTALIKNIEFHPGMSRSLLENLYQKSTFLVSTSESEGFPNVVLEALKCGTPLLSFQDYDSLITRSQAGIIASDIEGFANALATLETEKWQKLSEAAHTLAVKEFSPKNIGAYEKLLLA